MGPTSKDELRIRLLAIFREEAADHLRAIARDVSELEGETLPAQVDERLEQLFRTVHTLKGAARSLSIGSVERLCHEIEDLCSEGRQAGAFDAESRELLRDLTDQLVATTTRALEAPTPAPPPAVAPERSAAPPPAPTSPPPASPEPPAAAPISPPPTVAAGPEPKPSAKAEAKTKAKPHTKPDPRPLELVAPAAEATGGPAFIRLETSRLQRLGLMTEELIGPRLAMQARVDEARDLVGRLASLDVDQASAERHPKELRAAEQTARQFLASLTEDNRTLRGVIDGLVEELRRTRMMPASELLAVFPAMVDDLAGEVGKDIVWRTLGADLLIDRQIAERIKDPLIHIVRNAVDHGIEPAEARAKAGKPAQGVISLNLEPAEGGRVAIEVADDGAGINLSALREAAVRNRFVSREDAALLSDEALAEMVFESSLSTRTVISPVSGRGLGLAIVRERVERLGGSVHIASTPGKGTLLRLEVPAALANFHGIGARAGEAFVIWPREAVERSLALSEEVYEAAQARGAVQIDDVLLPFGSLAHVLGQPLEAAPAGRRGLRSCLVIRSKDRRGVLAVDEVSGNCEVVVKELRPPLLRVRHVLAAGLLGNGRLGLILRTADVLDTLIDHPRRAAPAPRPVRRQGKPRLLVVDDSITTRAMETGLLEAAGYEVHAAADGMEAWTVLQSGAFDAVISDIDMPRMDGFELTERIRADARLKQLPIVLVTALEKREDHERGLRLGANAYMMKSAFDQSMLIDLVRRVL